MSISRKGRNVDDGIYLALQTCCPLEDMEFVQFHPTGVTILGHIVDAQAPREYEGKGNVSITRTAKGSRADMAQLAWSSRSEIK